MNITLSLLPLVLGIAVIALMQILERSHFPVRGISPSYFASVGLLFGLFASLVATDAWQRTNKTALMLASEVSALRSILRIGEAEPQDYGLIRSSVSAYADEVRKREIGSGAKNSALAPPPYSLHQLYLIGARPGAFGGNIAVNTSYMSSLEKVRESRLQRLDLYNNHIPFRNYAILFMMGFLTQIAIGFSHGGNRIAIIYAVMLFSFAFSGAIYFIEAFDNPYDVGYATHMSALAEVL